MIMENHGKHNGIVFFLISVVVSPLFVVASLVINCVYC